MLLLLLAMEALKKAHKEQLEREVERATRLCGGTGDSVGLRNQLQYVLLSSRLLYCIYIILYYVGRQQSNKRHCEIIMVPSQCKRPP